MVLCSGNNGNQWPLKTDKCSPTVHALNPEVLPIQCFVQSVEGTCMYHIALTHYSARCGSFKATLEVTQSNFSKGYESEAKQERPLRERKTSPHPQILLCDIHVNILPANMCT